MHRHFALAGGRSDGSGSPIVITGSAAEVHAREIPADMGPTVWVVNPTDRSIVLGSTQRESPASEHTVPPEITQRANDETKQLSFPEAAQVYGVLKAVLDKLQLVGVITVDPQEQAMVLTQSVGEEISTMITEQRELETKFEFLIGQQHVLRNAANKSDFGNLQLRLTHMIVMLNALSFLVCLLHPYLHLQHQT